MKNNNEVENKTKKAKFSGLRVKEETKFFAEKILANANKKSLGKKIFMDDVVTMALKLVTKEHVEMLQKSSLRNKDKQFLAWKIYCKKVKKVSEDEFIGVIMSEEYFKIFNSIKDEINAFSL